jgi:hypothetical protein
MPMPAPARAAHISNETPASSVDALGRPPEKCEAIRELPTENVAVAVRNSAPTSIAVLRYGRLALYWRIGARTASAAVLGDIAVSIFIPLMKH